MMNNNLLRRILHILYPTRCPVCGCFIEYNDSFCKECECSVIKFDGEYSIKGADGFCAAFVYDENISPAIMLLKAGICGNADFALGTALANKIKLSKFSEDIDIIIPIPMHKRDVFRRGYNQSELIAKQVGKILGIEVCTKAVSKMRITEAQKNLTRSERMINLDGAFEVIHPELILNKRILLLDDVCTTGSTLGEVTKILKNNNAAKVYCSSCCKTKLNK